MGETISEDIEDAERWIEYWAARNRDPRWYIAFLLAGLGNGVVIGIDRDGEPILGGGACDVTLRSETMKEATEIFRLCFGRVFYVAGEDT